MIELAKLDLQKETTIPELVFSCCQFFPIKKALMKLIELAQRNENDEKLAKNVIDFQDDEYGFNCLTTIFDTTTKYTIATQRLPTGPMLREIEDSFFFLIELFESNNLFLDKALNQTSKLGDTL